MIRVLADQARNIRIVAEGISKKGYQKERLSEMAIAIILIVILAVYVIVSYNSLTKAKNRIELAEQELLKYEETGDERDIDNAKKYYTAVIRDYNNLVEGFPTKFIAELFNFPKMHTEEFDEGL